jgi:hypothetical protein
MRPLHLGDVIKSSRRAHRLILGPLSDQVTKEDAAPIGPQHLSAIRVHDRVPAPYGLREQAQVLMVPS